LARGMRRVSRVRVPKGKRLEQRVRELEAKLADSVPKTELETIRSNLQSKIAELQSRLSESVPKTKLDATKTDLQTRITDHEQGAS